MRKTTVKCRVVFKYICDNLDERLDSPQCREIRGHLARCPNCLAYLDSLKKTIELYRGYSHPRLSANVRKRLHMNLRRRVSSLVERE